MNDTVPGICGRPSCSQPAKYGCRGMCEPDYRRTVRMGINGYVPAGPAREHIAKLRALGWTWEQIAHAAGVSTWVPHKVGTGQTRRMLKDRAAAVLGVPLVPRDSHRGVNTAGTRRRVQALAWMGWTCEEIARRAGTTPNTLRTLILPSRGVSFALSRRVAAVYNELSLERGPSKVAAGRARQLGFAPPLAWDDDTIDDPAAKPNLGDGRARGRLDLAEEARFLLGYGLSTFTVAKRLGVSEPWIRAVINETGGCGMNDLVVPFDCPSRGELWHRIRLAESILGHRSIVPESTRQELLKVLRGESVAEPNPKEVS